MADAKCTQPAHSPFFDGTRMHTEIIKKSGEYWSKITRDGTAAGKVSWGNSTSIQRWKSQRICGRPSDPPFKALFRRCEEKFGAKQFGRAVSVGCGNGALEISLVTQGLIDSFVLYEVSTERARQAMELAQARGIADRIEVRLADITEPGQGGSEEFDLVLWNHALHHMLDTPEALRWSRDRLKTGGILMMNDFVGASRFQWSDEALHYASEARAALPPEVLRNPRDPANFLPTKVRRPPMAKLIARDPTEAADSDRILPALNEVFTDVDTVMLGGTIYHLALDELMANLVGDERGEEIIRAMLVADGILSDKGLNNFAVALARKT